MRKKRIKKRTIIIGLLCLLVTITYTYRHFIRVQNIFDWMYFSRIHSRYVESSFDKMPQIEPKRRDDEGYYREIRAFYNYYEDKYLREGESLVIVCDSNKKMAEIIAVKRFQEFQITYRYKYDVRKKQLTEALELEYGGLHIDSVDVLAFREYSENIDEILLVVEEYGLTKEDLLQYKKYFLYDKLLTDWLDANHSRFSINRWGRVQFIEVLPLETSK